METVSEEPFIVNKSDAVSYNGMAATLQITYLMFLRPCIIV